ncbi:Protein-serine/threonine phosphatase [Heracleum sosnowskyi]|uniref:protein-serine/threonine phosphatase n=1 Tax=Heracleum sosnowskyi TaxID=360622 RepID=A0AAD8MXY7_9APIA|nr:Protein-serine/threonine phosphatase [Heracleum sosnowskyi]
MEKTVSGDVMNDTSNTSSKQSSCKRNARASRRRKLELGRAKDVAGGEEDSNGFKRRKMQMFQDGKGEGGVENGELSQKTEAKLEEEKDGVSPDKCPKFGLASICGRRRDMEDFVAVHPSFCSKVKGDASEFHFFAVYDGHGCSHVAKRCKERLHELVKEELGGKEVVESVEWKEALEKSFGRMDEEVITCKEAVMLAAGCRCLLPSPESDAVGSTAVVALVTPDKIVVANCGDSRAVLARQGKIIPLSVDHKPDRPDELSRIQAAGGRVIYWDGARVLGVLAMSRAIGDSYLKPYVISQPEVTIIDRTAEDECLILASDGLWDMVSNQTACGVARMCLDGKVASMTPPGKSSGQVGEYDDQACAEASLLLTKLALVRKSCDNVSVVVINLRKET